MKLKVLMQQYVEMVAEVEIEAPDGSYESIQKVIQAAKERNGNPGPGETVTWINGDDAYDVRVYGVMNEANEEIWAD